MLVSAALRPGSFPGQALTYVIERGTLLISAQTASELRSVLLRPRLNPYLLPEEASEFLASILRYSEPVAVVDSVVACRDPSDDMFLELAVSGDASHIVSGDQDMLSLHPFRGVPILTPRAFIEAWA